MDLQWRGSEPEPEGDGERKWCEGGEGWDGCRCGKMVGRMDMWCRGRVRDRSGSWIQVKSKCWGGGVIGSDGSGCLGDIVVVCVLEGTHFGIDLGLPVIHLKIYGAENG